MSAWMVSHAHIDVVIDCAKQYAPELIGDRDETEIGKMLLLENVRSLRARYPSDYEELIPASHLPTTYVYRPTNLHLEAGAASKAVGCLAYQSCESDDYDATAAGKFACALREKLDLLGSDRSGPWGWEERDIPGRA